LFISEYIPKADLLPADKLAPLIDECSQLCRILDRSVTTAKYPNSESPPDSLRDEAVTDDPFPTAE